MSLSGLKVGYGPYDKTLRQPGDRRRFVFYAKARGIDFEIADPKKDYDLVYLTARADIARWSRYGGKARVVFELIDSYLALPRYRPKNMLRGVAKYVARETSSLILDYHKGIEAMARRADAVVCSTEEQRADLEKLCQHVQIILDVQREVERVVKTDYSRGDTLHVVWEGLVHTLDAFAGVRAALENFGRTDKIAVHLVTDLTYYRYMKRFLKRSTQQLVDRVVPGAQLYQWDEHLLPHIVTACDIALIPLRLDDPFSNGKPENKLLIFWRMAMPTLTSGSPAYRRAMRGAGLDMTCNNPTEWASALERYGTNEDLRREAGEKGRRFCLEHHSGEKVLQRWDALFDSVLN